MPFPACTPARFVTESGPAPPASRHFPACSLVRIVIENHNTRSIPAPTPAGLVAELCPILLHPGSFAACTPARIVPKRSVAPLARVFRLTSWCVFPVHTDCIQSGTAGPKPLRTQGVALCTRTHTHNTSRRKCCKRVSAGLSTSTVPPGAQCTPGPLPPRSSQGVCVYVCVCVCVCV